MKPRSPLPVWGTAVLAGTATALTLPIYFPPVVAVSLSLGAALLFVGAGMLASREAKPPLAAPELPELPQTVVTEPKPAPATAHLPENVPPPPAPSTDLLAMEELAWSLHEGIIAKIRSLLIPLSQNLFEIKNDLRGLLANADQLEASFRNDSQGLHQTVRRFEAQSGTIREFAGEMDLSVDRLELSNTDLGRRMASITEAIHQISDVAERIKVLSINASIEAARAGQQGAGFKVISQEVRRLAEDTNQFSDQAEKTVSEAVTAIGAVFEQFTGQYRVRAHEIRSIQSTTQELENFLKDLFQMIDGIFQDYDRFVGSLESNLDQVSPTLQQAEIGTQQIENTWKSIRQYVADELGAPSGKVPLSAAAARKLFETFSRHLTTPLEAQVVEAWARAAGVPLKAESKQEDITLF